MSESEVTQIRDEDVLRRMWQQTEDFSRKKEIRAHMYRLREERLRNLYSPEPTADGKGCEFTSSQGHVKSFADQSFQSMKSKEVRDAGSPPKEFTYRGQDLKELSNAGWNVESEDRTADDGRTHVKSVNANIEGRYDVEGGRGQFAAVDRQRQAVTEFRDDKSSLRRDETRSDNAAHEHVERQTDDGTRHTTTTSSSNTSSRIQQVSSTKSESVPYVTDDDYDLRHTSHDTNRNDRITRVTNRNDYDQTSKKSDFNDAELISRKVEYPDDNTKVIVETRSLPDGTRVTSTRREFRAPAHSTRSESYQTRSESKSYSSQQVADTRDSTSRVTRQTNNYRTDDIVDSQRNVDDSDFKRQIRQYTVRDDEDYNSNARQHYETKSDRKVSDHLRTEDSQAHFETSVKEKVDYSTSHNENNYTKIQRRTVDQRNDNRVDETDRRQVTTTFDHNTQHNIAKDIHHIEEGTEIITSNKREIATVHDTTTRDKTNIEKMHKISEEKNREVPKDKNKISALAQNRPNDEQRANDRNRNVSKDIEPSYRISSTENKISKEHKTEEVVERKTSSDQYQTTYQNDFPSRKVSTDWSPTHQAWASTLRSDTPSTTRPSPSTRASSPGSRTFKSSTSSLRSSVSPDKTFRKPNSRGGSPNKIDRGSPTRTIISDRYSSTHSSQSVHEIRSNKTSSPERKPPTGRSPNETGFSPDRKSQEHRQRQSASPEKRPHNFEEKPNASPVRKPSYKSSPTDREAQRKPTDAYSPRSSPSPDRKPGHQKPSNSPRSSVSPDKKSGYTKPLGPRTSHSPDRALIQNTPSNSPNSVSSHKPINYRDVPDKSRSSLSPDRKPGYMRPTAVSQPHTRRPSQPHEETNRKSPTRQIFDYTPDRKYPDVVKSDITIKDDHYRFVDEETKTYSQKDTTTLNKTVTLKPKSSPSGESPEFKEHGEDSPDYCIPTRSEQYPSQKETVVDTENDDLYGKVSKTEEITRTVKKNQHTEGIPEDIKKVPSRDSSPLKYGTFDKKERREVATTEVVTVKETADTTDIKYDSLKRLNNTEPSVKSASPIKKRPRESTSPLKSPIKDTKHKLTKDFITTEITTEEINKKTTSKAHPRQLITPSSSPTRTPKTEPEPSTGQSSPTTSVSGFVYYGSPRPDQPMVTDLDDHCPDSKNQTGTKRPDILHMRRSPSPSKIPCRSPSPEKHTPSTDSLPRKSSLKKPSTEVYLVSPIEKPPSNFRVSPNDDKYGLLEHHITKKDQSQEPETGELSTTVNPKPPLQRRETYEERCKKILGMVDDTTSESITRETRFTKKTRPSHSSPSESPCDSPTSNELSQFSVFPSKSKINDNKKDVTDFIAQEKEHVIITKTPLGETSPTKLQDVTTKTFITKKTTEEEDEHTGTTKTIKYTSTRRSPGKALPKDKPEKKSTESPEKKPIQDLPNKISSPRSTGSSPSRSSLSPQRKHPKEPSPQRQSPEKSHQTTKITTSVTSQHDMTTSEDVQQSINIIKTSKSNRILESPNRQMPKSQKTPKPEPISSHSDNVVSNAPIVTDHIPGYMKTTTAVTSKFESLTSRDVNEHIISKPTVKKDDDVRVRSTSPTKIESLRRPDLSPQRKSSKDTEYKSNTGHSRTPSPTKRSQHSDTSPTRKTHQQESCPQQNDSSSSRLEPTKIPGYMKPTITSISKSDKLNDESEHIHEDQDVASPEEPCISSPQPEPAEIPGYMKSTITSISKLSKIHDDREDAQETITSTIEERNSRRSKSPTRKEHQPTEDNSPKPSDQQPSIQKPLIPGYMKTTTSVAYKYDIASTENSEEYTSPHPKSPGQESQKTDIHSRSMSPQTPTEKLPRRSTTSPEKKTGLKYPVKDEAMPESKLPKDTPRSSVSPDRLSYMKPTASIMTKYDSVTTASQETREVSNQRKSSPERVLQLPHSPIRSPLEQASKDKNVPKTEETRQLQTPSPIKKTTKITEDFVLSEQEQEILNKVQKSLRKLSPERKEKSPSPRGRSPTKSTTSLQDLDIVIKETVETQDFTNKNLSEIIEEQTCKASDLPRVGKSKLINENKTQIKTARTVSPVKKVLAPASPTKSRSISPKKTISHIDRPQSPQKPKSNPAYLTRKPTPATLATTKIEKITTETKKTNGITKQNVLNKITTTKTASKSISPTGKPIDPESKRPISQKKENASPRKDIVTRTTSELTMKPKKTSPQRMRSKPEIQVSDMSTKTPKSEKPHTKFPNKPKSATALNTSTEEDDIIIDVQQSKSSRENSPDRICPTPINFSEDVGTPRFPDEVNEPDDDFVKRTHNTIHETETLVDDIVEICEDEELFVQKPKRGPEHDDSVLTVTEKVNKFTNKILTAKQPRDTTNSFKETEKRVHSDFINENLKSDECLLTVSEKVTKFAKGPKDSKDNRSPSRKITDEYDQDTIYQDDYTKLSVNDKAHLFVETAENIKVTKVKPVQKVERPDLSNVDESLKSDDCLLSVSDKVNKFVKTAENIITDTQTTENTNRTTRESHKKIIRQVTVDDDDDDDEIFDTHEVINPQPVRPEVIVSSLNSKETKVKTSDSLTSKAAQKTPVVKITTLRSSEAVKKAKALFENIATTQTKENIHTTKTSTKLTDIGVIKKAPKTETTPASHPSTEPTNNKDPEIYAPLTGRRPSTGTIKSQHPHADEKERSSPSRQSAKSPEAPNTKSPMKQTVEITTKKTVLSRYPAPKRAESPRNRSKSPIQRTESSRQRAESPRQVTVSPSPHAESEKPDKVPGYLRPTMTSQIKEEPKVIEEIEVSTRRGSGKFGVELRRTSVDRSTVSSERRRSVEHHQPCIEDIFDLDLLEQMLEKVTGYEQRRRIRAQIRVARNQSVNYNTKTTKTTTTVTSKMRSPERTSTKSPERTPKASQLKRSSPDRLGKSTPQITIPDRIQPKETQAINGHPKESTPAQARQRSPEKSAKPSLASKTPNRQPSPDKKRPLSPSKPTPKPKSNRFNEYASAYMKKVGLNESDKMKFTESKIKKSAENEQTVVREYDVKEFTTKTFNERTSSRHDTEIVRNGKRSPSPGKKQSPERKVQISDKVTPSSERKALSPGRKDPSPERHLQSPDRIYRRTPSPDFKRPKAETAKETITKTVYDIEKKLPTKSKQVQEEKPSWVTNRNLKKVTSETRTYSSKKIESEKPKYRAASPSKVITKPTDVITSSYGPGPLDADGRPLFGIKALRNGASNFQVKGTVIRQEFHSRNGGKPEGTVSVTAYSSQPEELARLLAEQGAPPPSTLHGLTAVTTTKKFGGDTGNSISNVHTKEERASLEQFTHTDRKTESRVESLDTATYDRMEDVSSTRRLDSKNDRLHDKSKTIKKEEKLTEIKRGSVEERRERVEKREEKKSVRQSSVKSLTEKYIKSTNESGKTDRTSYPKAGLILRTTSMRDSVSSDDQPGLTRGDSEHSLGSGEDTVMTTTERTGDGVRTTTTRTTHHGPTVTTTRTVHEPVITKKTSTVITQEPVITKKISYVTQEGGKVTQRRGTSTTERSFLDSNTKVTGVQDILTRMKNADIVIQEGDTAEDAEARALLNKFLGATVLMAGMQGYVTEQPQGKVTVTQETVRSTGSGGKVTTSSIQEFDIDHCWDERLLKKLLDECTDYEQRRRLRARIRALMAEQEACASAVTEALGAAGADAGAEGEGGADAREEEEVTVTSSVRRDSSDKTVSSSTTTTKTSKVIEMTRSAPKPVSPFAKFRQLEKQNSTNSPNSPKSPQSPGSPSQPYFKFTDPALQCSALTIKERLLQWCRDKTRDYENVKLENFSTSWADGLAFCALVHHFLPHTFDYSKLTPERRRHNFTLAFKVADEKAGIYPLLDVDDMVAMRKPDWKCVFTYVQAIYRRFKDQD